MTGAAGAGTTPRPSLSVGDRDIPVVLPRWGDPRLKLAAVLITVQVLGQTVLDFKLSIAQILVTVGTAAALETAVTLWREGALVWPASAMLTGNSVALLLRTTGTRHGDWWSMNGIEFFVLAAVLSLLSKYLVRPGGGRHLFNPSNVGLVWVLLVVGPTQVFPQYLYWGPLAAPVITSVVVIAVGAIWVLRPLRMLPMAATFMLVLGAFVGVLAVGGNGFFAIWHPEPVTGWFYWVTIVVSPETMIFVFFMMSDPVTAPRTPRGRVLFGAATALVAGVLIAPQPTEFGVKLALLASLTVTCAGASLLDRVGRALEVGGWVPRLRQRLFPADEPVLARTRAAATRPMVIAAAIIVLGATLDTLALADDERLILIERGLSGEPNPQ